MIAAIVFAGCDRKKGKQVIEVDTQDLILERDGHPILEVRPYANGTSIKILSSNGEWIEMRPASPTGLFDDSLYMQRSNPDGTPLFIQVLPDGTAINRSKYPIGTWPGDEGYQQNQEAEQDEAQNPGDG